MLQLQAAQIPLPTKEMISGKLRELGQWRHKIQNMTKYYWHTSKAPHRMIPPVKMSVASRIGARDFYASETFFHVGKFTAALKYFT